MADETVETTTTTETQETVTTEEAVKGPEESVSTEAEKAADTVSDPLFDDEATFSDDELADVPTETATTSEGKKDTATSQPKEGADTKEADKGEIAAEAGKTEAEKAAEATKTVDDERPPQGHVPIGALHEERAKARALRDELAELRQEIASIKTAKATTTADTEREAVRRDQVASLASLGEKLESLRKLKDEAVDDPVGTTEKTIDAVADTIAALTQSIADADRKREEADNERARQTEEQRIVSEVTREGHRKMEQFVPGILDTAKDINANLTEFAKTNGLDLDFLRSVTNPATTIMGPDGEARFLGDDAAFFVAFLNSTYGLSKQVNEDAVAAAVKAREDAIRADLRKEITLELTAKLRRGESLDFKSIGELPGSATSDTEEIFSSDAMLSEAELSKLPAAERDRYLMG